MNMSAKQSSSEHSSSSTAVNLSTSGKSVGIEESQIPEGSVNRAGINSDQNYFAAFSHLARPVASGYPLYPYSGLGHGNPSSGHCFYDTSYTTTYSYDERYANAMDYSNGVRRKNATKETTSALKSWLSEHKKNPYPTKGEKIMLAILTRMTLTQVSTWFANARRRLKKENKMTWSPRTCCGKNEEECRSKKALADSSGHPINIHDTVTSDDSDSDYGDDHIVTAKKTDPVANTETNGRKRHLNNETVHVVAKKPKIWSIAETVSGDSVKHKSEIPDSTTHSSPYSLVFPPWPHITSSMSQQGSGFMVNPELLYRSLLNSTSSYLSNVRPDSKFPAVRNFDGPSSSAQSQVTSTTVLPETPSSDVN